MPVSNEWARSMTNESLTNKNSIDQELLCQRTLLALVTDSIHCEQGPSAATYDTAAEMAKHYFLSDPDPYKFDPGGMLAVHMSMGVSSEDKVLQLAALALHWLHTGLKIIAQLQSVDKHESVAYTTNSKAQGYMTGIVNDPPPGCLATSSLLSTGTRGLLWQNQEIPTPGTLASDKVTQLPHPQFNTQQPHPLVDPLQQQVFEGLNPRIIDPNHLPDRWTPPWFHKSHPIMDGWKACIGIPLTGGPQMEKDPPVEGWPGNGPPGPGPPDRGLPAVGVNNATHQQETYYEPKFKLEFQPSDLPEYDGSDNAFIMWTEDLDCYAAGSC
ncbi:hypothetical protein BS47DRAFT_1364590 [Hydnum rufescens UP504]|uniref:Uncharacterized protein n=1 Tax=Hydnum rufescens UP504 TaxID=1448309 RepID=A0A9P6AT58_9AGAM|nr:hypothetical protein BS47DRAFT_1364590 [Hydnum rufescens UP504]